jgi:hypothetical protein
MLIESTILGLPLYQIRIITDEWIGYLDDYSESSEK